MSNPLAETHVPLSINIFDLTHRALVRRHLTVDRLISEILREFAGELDLNRKYILIYDGRQLDPDLVIGDTQFDEHKELVFGYYEPVRVAGAAAQAATEFTAEATHTEEKDTAQVASLRELETGQEFPLRSGTVIIGRAGSGTTETIDIDLSPFREGRTVSRPHARITGSNGVYRLEALKDQRPVFVNDDEVPFGQRYTLQPGDIVGIGKVQLVFELR